MLKQTKNSFSRLPTYYNTSLETGFRFLHLKLKGEEEIAQQSRRPPQRQNTTPRAVLCSNRKEQKRQVLLADTGLDFSSKRIFCYFFSISVAYYDFMNSPGERVREASRAAARVPVKSETSLSESRQSRQSKSAWTTKITNYYAKQLNQYSRHG